MLQEAYSLSLENLLDFGQWVVWFRRIHVILFEDLSQLYKMVLFLRCTHFFIQSWNSPRLINSLKDDNEFGLWLCFRLSDDEIRDSDDEAIFEFGKNHEIIGFLYWLSENVNKGLFGDVNWT